MFLDITSALRAPGEEIPFTHCDEIPPQEIFGEEITFTDVVFSGAYAMLGESLHLTGVFRAVAHGRCAGCLKAVDYQVEVPLDEIFTRLTKYSPAPVDDEEDDERLVFEGSKVDLSHLALTLAVLELPMRFVCGDDCEAMKALQPSDSQMTHACQKDMPDQHPFSALQQLLTKDQEV